MPDAPTTPTLLERMTAVMSEEKARGWIEADRVAVNGEPVTDPARPTPTGQDGDRWLITGG